MAWGAVLLGFSSATQDIVIDAYRIESAPPRLQAMLSSTYIAGYRSGQMVAVAGGLWLAQVLGSSAENYSYDAWQTTYLVMAAVMMVGVITTLLISEPQHAGDDHPYPAADYLRFFLVFLASVGLFVLIVANLAVDIIYGWLDPRIRYQ